MNKALRIELSSATWQECCTECSSVRRRVFIEEQNVPESDEWDGKDKHAIHVLVRNRDNNELLGCARVLHISDSALTWHSQAKITRMAILKPYRGQGLGRQLLSFANEHTRQLGVTRVLLDAQIQALAFYQKAGFEIQGERFMDAGIEHIKMTKTL